MFLSFLVIYFHAFIPVWSIAVIKPQDNIYNWSLNGSIVKLRELNLQGTWYERITKEYLDEVFWAQSVWQNKLRELRKNRRQTWEKKIVDCSVLLTNFCWTDRQTLWHLELLTLMDQINLVLEFEKITICGRFFTQAFITGIQLLFQLDQQVNHIKICHILDFRTITLGNSCFCSNQ